MLAPLLARAVREAALRLRAEGRTLGALARVAQVAAITHAEVEAVAVMYSQLRYSDVQEAPPWLRQDARGGAWRQASRRELVAGGGAARRHSPDTVVATSAPRHHPKKAGCPPSARPVPRG